MNHRGSFILYAGLLLAGMGLLAACSPRQTNPGQAANIANPAAVYCEQQGGKSKIVTAADGSQGGMCVFQDGSTCDEWAYFRGECKPGEKFDPMVPDGGTTAGVPTQPPSEGGITRAIPTEMTDLPMIPTALPIRSADTQGWWMYTQPVYHFSIMLPEDWVAEEVTASDPLMNGHLLTLHPKNGGEEKIRMSFRKTGEDTLLWPTGVGQGEFIPQGTLEVAGQPVQRLLLVCPGGDVTSIYYHGSESTSNIIRGDLEFGFIFTAASQHCQTGASLAGKMQRLGETIIATLKLP